MDGSRSSAFLVSPLTTCNESSSCLPNNLVAFSRSRSNSLDLMFLLSNEATTSCPDTKIHYWRTNCKNKNENFEKFKIKPFEVDDYGVWFVPTPPVPPTTRTSFDEEDRVEESTASSARAWIGEDDGDKDDSFLTRKEEVRPEEEDDESGRDVKRGILREGFGYVVDGTEGGAKLRMVAMNGLSNREREREGV